MAFIFDPLHVMDSKYVVIDLSNNFHEIYRTWNQVSATIIYKIEKAKGKSVFLLDEEWGNSLWEWDEDETIPEEENLGIEDCSSIIHNADRFYSIYEKYIGHNNINKDNLCYSYIYLDNDSIPEMIINSGSEYGGYTILSKQDNEIIEMNTWRLDFDYIEKTGLCAYQNGKQGHFFSHVWLLSKGKFEKIFDVETSDNGISGTCFYYDNEVDYSKWEELYMQTFRNKGNVINVDSIKRWNGFPQIRLKTD